MFMVTKTVKVNALPNGNNNVLKYKIISNEKREEWCL